ncbi:Helix-turn-helix [Daejeonella rubra]|uniref:Helix-turn-helix n=1 Tax=Daejeonella rubra TaxID=990371 RepID=A0A1G9PXD5_9SPHI|nr:helix-turn-helix transcriptional regulator [Daejeonella rubra]SDM03420.1 Helix-turn-helix [Daejeonella rubra]
MTVKTKKTYLSYLRRKLNLSQEEIAKEFNIRQSYLSMIESGKRSMPIGLAKALSNKYSVDIGLFLAESNIPFNESQLPNISGVFQVSLPFISANMSQGHSCNGTDELAKESAIVVSQNGEIFGSDCILIELGDNSMRDTYATGTRFIGRKVPETDYSYQTGVVAVCYPGNIIVRRIKENTLLSDGILTLHSDNKESGGSFSLAKENIVCIYKLIKIVWGEVL